MAKIIWKQLNSILNPKGNTTQSQCQLKIGENMIADSTQVSNKFNNFFIESVKNLASGLSSMNDVDQASNRHTWGVYYEARLVG